MQKTIVIAVTVMSLLVLGACRTYPDYSNDFRFPIMNGDIAKGQEAFVAMGCPVCHQVEGVELPEYTGLSPVTVKLGGELMFAKTYGDLATSILNPDHVLSERYLEQFPPEQRKNVVTSPMYVNPDMKVTELIDIVAFLNSRYSLLPGYTEYYY